MSQLDIYLRLCRNVFREQIKGRKPANIAKKGGGIIGLCTLWLKLPRKKWCAIDRSKKVRLITSHYQAHPTYHMSGKIRRNFS